MNVLKKGLSKGLLEAASSFFGSTLDKGQKPVRNFIEKWFDEIEIKQEKDELKSYCRDQLFSLRNNIMYRFELFLEDNFNLLYELDFFTSNVDTNTSPFGTDQLCII